MTALTTSVLTAGLLGGALWAADEPSPAPKITLQLAPRIAPGAPILQAPRIVTGPTLARSTQPSILKQYPIVIVEKDPADYPIRVTTGRGDRYPIRIIRPAGAPEPGDSSTPPLIITPPLGPERAPALYDSGILKPK